MAEVFAWLFVGSGMLGVAMGLCSALLMKHLYLGQPDPQREVRGFGTRTNLWLCVCRGARRADHSAADWDRGRELDACYRRRFTFSLALYRHLETRVSALRGLLFVSRMPQADGVGCFWAHTYNLCRCIDIQSSRDDCA